MSSFSPFARVSLHGGYLHATIEAKWPVPGHPSANPTQPSEAEMTKAVEDLMSAILSGRQAIIRVEPSTKTMRNFETGSLQMASYARFSIEV